MHAASDSAPKTPSRQTAGCDAVEAKDPADRIEPMSPEADNLQPKFEDLSDEELVERALDDDFEAFEQLVHRYDDKAFRLAYSLVKDESEAQDVVQEAFLNTYRKLDTYAGEAKFASWIYRVVTNAALMRLRKQDRRREIGMEDVGPSVVEEEAAFSEIPSWRIQADEAAEQQELREQIFAAVDELKPKYQAAFLLREIEGLSIAEIADVLELSEGAVKSRLHRARLHLQAVLEPYLGRSESITE